VSETDTARRIREFGAHLASIGWAFTADKTDWVGTVDRSHDLKFDKSM